MSDEGKGRRKSSAYTGHTELTEVCRLMMMMMMMIALLMNDDGQCQLQQPLAIDAQFS